MDTNQRGVLGGVYEIGIGIPTDAIDECINHWQAFGYRVGPRGALSAYGAKSLYNVESDLTSVRLLHSDSNVGLVRIMAWDKPNGYGLNMANIRVPGVRWTVQKTADLLNIYNHALVAQRKGMPINVRGPDVNPDQLKKAEEKIPFREPIAANHELAIFQPLFQQLIMKRWVALLPNYGTVAEDSVMRTSEICHFATTVHNIDPAAYDLFTDVLGFVEGESLTLPYVENRIWTVMFDMVPGEEVSLRNFNNPNSGKGLEGELPGRFRPFIIHSASREKDRFIDSQPGNLGYSLFTCRVGNLSAMRDGVDEAGATNITKVVEDEFGSSAFSFTAPDGYVWTLIQG